MSRAFVAACLAPSLFIAGVLIYLTLRSGPDPDFLPLDTITFHGPNQIIQYEGEVIGYRHYVIFRDVQGTKHVFSPPFTIEFGKEN